MQRKAEKGRDYFGTKFARVTLVHINTPSAEKFNMLASRIYFKFVRHSFTRALLRHLNYRHFNYGKLWMAAPDGQFTSFSLGQFERLWKNDFQDEAMPRIKLFHLDRHVLGADTGIGQC